MNLDKKNVGTVGFICGAFDLLHPGHVHLLLECSKLCDWLMIGLHTDPTIDRPDTKNKPIQTAFERWYQINALNLKAEIIPYDTEQDLEHMLAVLPIDVRFIGSDYVGKSITGEQICDSRRIHIHYVDRSHNWSSSELRKRFST
jgi:glycerol-3-phosphate cytidylyltransferase